jgi:hypothetical protein
MRPLLKTAKVKEAFDKRWSLPKSEQPPYNDLDEQVAQTAQLLVYDYLCHEVNYTNVLRANRLVDEAEHVKHQTYAIDQIALVIGYTEAHKVQDTVDAAISDCENAITQRKFFK